MILRYNRYWIRFYLIAFNFLIPLVLLKAKFKHKIINFLFICLFLLFIDFIIGFFFHYNIQFCGHNKIFFLSWCKNLELGLLWNCFVFLFSLECAVCRLLLSEFWYIIICALYLLGWFCQLGTLLPTAPGHAHIQRFINQCPLYISYDGT